MTAGFRLAFVVPIALALLVAAVLVPLEFAPSEGCQGSVHRVRMAPAGPMPPDGEAISTLSKCVGEARDNPQGSGAADPVTLSSWQQPSDPAPHRRGFVPPPMDLSHLTAQRAPSVYAADSVPSSFDWRDNGGVNYVTAVKDQGQCGACYAFAALGNLESKLLIDGAGTYDLSENNTKECNWYGTSCAGGDYRIAVNLFSKQGTVLESCDPYVASDVSCTAGCPYQQTILDWRLISGDDVPATETLKHYIYNGGPVYVSMYAGDGDAWADEFGSYDGTYTLYYGGTERPNHAVLVVGWDDDLERPGGSGGWIVKNSWGTGWGDDGYFRIAYGSASIGKWASFVHGWQPYDVDGALWYYDEGGWSTSVGTGSDTTAWGLATFMPDQDASAVRVELWTTDATTDVDVYLYDDFDGDTLTGLLGQSVDHAFGEAGYHSIPFDEPVAVTADDDAVAVIKVTNATHTYPVAADRSGPYELGRTYFSSSGSSWIDLGAELQVDAAIRLRTSAVGAPVEADFSASPTSGPAPLTVDFTNLSAGDYDTCNWDFGDGSTSTDCSDPEHVYTDGGVYTVALEVSGLGGTDALTRTDYVDVSEPGTPPTASFTALPTSGVAPLDVTFTNDSTGDYDTCSWDFGDSSTSTDWSDPQHVYADGGVYTVALEVSGPAGSDALTRTDYITAYEPVEAYFSASPTSGLVPLEVEFSNDSRGDYETSLWEFGDGATSTVESPTHTYTVVGTYTVTLSVDGPGGTDVEAKSAYVVVEGFNVYLPLTTREG